MPLTERHKAIRRGAAPSLVRLPPSRRGEDAWHSTMVFWSISPGPHHGDPMARRGIAAVPPKPFAVLAYLVAHAGQVVSKETLLDAVWPNTAVTDGVLKTCLGQIRQMLGETARTPQYIATLYRRGYRFVAPVVESTEAGPAAPVVAPGAPPDLLPSRIGRASPAAEA